MTEPLTLAQRFHPDVLAAHAEFGGDLESMQALYDRPDHLALIASLRDANKALTTKAGFLHDYANMRDVQVVDLVARAEAAEAKLAKVEARLLNWQAKAAELDVDRDSLSAELAEARKVIEKSDEDLRSIHLHIEEHSFPRANGIISQALFRIRSFLASKEASHAAGI